MAVIELDVDTSELVQFTTQAINEILDDTTRLKINETIADMCDPYVPYISGNLAHDIVISPDGIEYSAEYAEKVYNGRWEHSKQVHPLASSQWDKVMLEDHEEELNAKLDAIVAQRIRELGYGG